MPLPTAWAQTWFRTSIQGYETRATFLQWWQIDGVPGAGWDPQSAVDAMRSWWSTAIFSTMKAAYPFTEVQGYMYWSAGWPVLLWPLTSLIPIFYDIGDPLPGRVGVVIRRETTTLDRRHQGRFSLNGVDESDVDGDVLTPGGLAAWQTTADLLLTQVLDQGITYTPRLVSYADATWHPITRHRVNPRLGRVMRRQHRRNTSIVVPPAPKPPPP